MLAILTNFKGHVQILHETFAQLHLIQSFLSVNCSQILNILLLNTLL